MGKGNKDRRTIAYADCDFGNEARKRHEGGVSKPTPRSVTAGGQAITIGVRTNIECLLDKLYQAGVLGSGEIAKTRYDAGLSLRSDYYDTHQSVPVSTFQPRGDADQSEMTERQAWNLKAYNCLVRELGKHGTLVQGVCCFDQPLRQADVARFCEGLDLLAELVDFASLKHRRDNMPAWVRAEIARVIRS